jgi:hypothetical protein
MVPRTRTVSRFRPSLAWGRLAGLRMAPS